MDGEVSNAGFTEVELIGIKGPLGHMADHRDMPETLDRAMAVAAPA